MNRVAAESVAPESRFARIAATIGDPTRARMLAALMGGEYLSAGELAAAIGLTALPDAAAHRRTAYACLDWSERRDHLGGRLAAALFEHCLSRDWLRRQAGSRVVRLTPAGKSALAPWLDAAADASLAGSRLVATPGAGPLS